MANQTTPAIQVKDSNVGIGTSSPAYKLDVSGSLNVAANVYNYIGGNKAFGGNGSTFLYLYTGTTALSILNNADSSELVRITNDGNVGIGTAAPATKLDVNGGINIANGNNLTWGGAYAAGIPTIVGYNAGAGGALYFYPNGSTSGTKMFIASDGNVGIGTTSPGSLLSVGDSFATIPGITVDTGNTGNSAFVARKTASKPAFGILPWDANVYLSAGIYYDGNSWIQNSNGTDNLLFDLQPGTGVNWYASNDSTSSWNVASAVNLWDASGQWTSTVKSTRTGNSYFTGGNVGIGTTSPQVELHVKGNNGWGEVRVEGQTFASGHGASLEFYSEGTALADVYASTSKDLILRTNGTTERMRITSAGNVGIGTTSPNRTLTVNGIVGVTNGTANTQQLVISTDANGAYLTSSYIGSSSYVPMIFETGGSERMRITTDGSLLVGATNPDIGGSVKGTIIRQDGSIVAARNIASPFHYQSPISADRMNTMGDGIMYSMWREGLFQAGIGATNASNMTFFTGDNSSASERMRITSAGNVGIGTTAPGAKLDVNGDITGRGSFNGYAASTHNLLIDWSAESQVTTLTNTNLFFGTNAQRRMTITGVGNVGIGTTSPGYKLEVNGDVGFSGGASLKWGGNTYLYGDNNIQIQAVVNGNTGWFINSSGNVGIGTTAPSAKLDVNGDINLTNYGSLTGGNSSNRMAIIKGTGASGNIEIGGLNNSDVIILTHVNERMRITGAGNVGIGTTAPKTILDIRPAGITGLTMPTFGTAAYGGIHIVPSGAATTEAWYGITFGNVASTSSERERSTAGIYTSASGTYGNKLYFATSNDWGIGAISRMMIDEAGNVGIGTTNPAAKLDVSGSIQAGSGSTFGAGSNGASIYMSSASGLGLSGNLGGYSRNLIKTDGSSVIEIGETGTSIITAINISAGDNTGVIALKTGGNNTRLYVNSSGNVGIGTTSPQSKLDIERDSRTGSHPTSLSLYVTGTMGTGNVGGQAGNIEFRHSNASQGIGFGYQAIYQTGDNPNEVLNILSKGTGALTLNAYAYSTGNVGIGTASPTEKLHVDGSVVVTYNNSYQGINSVGNKAILARVSPTTGIINYAEYATATNLNGFVMGSDDARVKGNIATDSLEFITNGSTRMTVLSSGYVGVNTTTPGTNFHVVGDVLIQTGALGVGVNPNATDGRIDASNDIVAYSSSDRRLKENITPIANALDKVKSLTGVEFDWKPEHKKAHGYEGHDTGVIAQEVQEVMPTAVRTNDTGYLAVRYEKMIGLLIEAMKEQQTQIDELKAKLDGLTK